MTKKPRGVFKKNGLSRETLKFRGWPPEGRKRVENGRSKKSCRIKPKNSGGEKQRVLKKGLDQQRGGFQKGK